MPLNFFSWSIAKPDGITAQEQREGGHCGVAGMVGERDGMWRGVDVDRCARRLRWIGRSWRKIAESLRGVSSGLMRDGVVNV